MCLMKKCFCWRDVKSPCLAIAIFALVTSIMQILVQVAAFGGDAGRAQDILQRPYDDKQSIIAKLYIALAVADFFVALFSLILLCGLEYTAGCRYAAVPWIIWIFLYILYESAINIFYFSQAFGNPGIFTQQQAYLIVPLVYWAVKEIILFLGWLYVVSWECYVDHPRDLDSVGSQSLQLIHTRSPNHYAAAGTASVGPIYYNGGTTQVAVHDNPRSYVSHFDVVRPAAGYSTNLARGGGLYGAGYYGPQRLIYTPN